MDSRNLGATGLRVSRIGLGLAALGRPAYINLGHGADLGARRSIDDLRRRTAAVLDAAWDAGVRYVDAARSYGRAEQFLAAWLASRTADEQPAIGSKWGYEYVGDWQVDADAHEVKEHSLAMYRRQLAQTRALLGTAVGLYQVHSATLDSGVLDDAALLDALADLRDDGTSVGLSLSGPRQAETVARALDIERCGERLFACVQATYNVLEPSAGRALATAHDLGLGVIVKEAVANGRLTPRADESVVHDVVGPIAARLGATVDAVAMAAVLDQPWADVVLSGAASVDQLRSNVLAADVALDDTARDTLGGLAEDPDHYWRQRDELAWT